jgi:hypothetical protein
VRDAVNPAEETRCRALEHAVEEWWSLHFGTSPINSKHAALYVPHLNSI